MTGWLATTTHPRTAATGPCLRPRDLLLAHRTVGFAWLLSGILPGRGGQRHIREEDCFMTLLFSIIKLNNTPGLNEKWLTLAEGLAIHHVGREEGGGPETTSCQPDRTEHPHDSGTSTRPAGCHKPEGHRTSFPARGGPLRRSPTTAALSHTVKCPTERRAQSPRRRAGHSTSHLPSSSSKPGRRRR